MNYKYAELYYIRAVLAPSGSGNLAIELNFKQVKGQTVQPVFTQKAPDGSTVTKHAGEPITWTADGFTTKVVELTSDNPWVPNFLII